MSTIRIDPTKQVGPIKPMNGVGGGPVTGNFEYDASDLFREAGIPFSRTHDIEYPFGSGEYVDIHCIFPNFDADVDDPASYNFVFTDEYLKAIIAAGAEPFYRLGSTIEHQPIKRYIYPPKSNEKWAQICSHIIAHYNEGWADGFHMNIRYWEIWNEPDLANRCWTGTHQQFFELYETAAKLIKREHPDVKVGGCAVTVADSPMTEEFLRYVAETHAPLDFFSWHGYVHTPAQAQRYADFAAALMHKYGFDDIESIYNEWNYVVRWDDTIQRSLDLIPAPMCAAFITSVMSVLQDGRTDKSMYYGVHGIGSSFNGLFRAGVMPRHGDPIPILPLKPYYAIKAWHLLDELGTQLRAEADDRDVYVTAAVNGDTLRALVTLYNDDAGFGESTPEPQEITVHVAGKTLVGGELRRVDETHDFAPEPLEGNTFTLAGNSFALVTWKLA